MGILTKPITDITAILIRWLYDLLAAHGIKSMIVTIVALALFSKLLSFLIVRIKNIVSKFVKSKYILKFLNGLSFAISLIIGIGIYLVMQNIGTYIPELKNSIFLTKSAFNLYSVDKSKIIFYIMFLVIEIFYYIFNNIIIPRLLKTKPNFKMKLLQIYTTCVIAASGFFLPIGILIYWGVNSIISMALNSITIIWRKMMRKKHPEKYKPKPQAINKENEKGALDKFLDNLFKKQQQAKQERQSIKDKKTNKEENVYLDKSLLDEKE